MRSIVAISAAAILMLAGCSSINDDAAIAEAYGSPESNELLLILDSCNAALSADVEEQLNEVTIRVTAKTDTTNDCQDVLTVRLSAPLGDRSVVDAFDGDAIQIQPIDDY